MKLVDIENLSAAELKAQKAELLKIADADPVELLARYIQARTDAKQRDEKLAEQGTTITNLNAAIERVTADHADAVRYAEKVNGEIEVLRERLVDANKTHVATCKGLQESTDATMAEARDTIEKLKANLIAVAKERDDAYHLAKARRTALAEVMKVISPVLAAE